MPHEPPKNALASIGFNAMRAFGSIHPENTLGLLEPYRSALDVPLGPPKPVPALAALGLFPKPAPELTPEQTRIYAWVAVARHPLDNIATDRFGHEIHWDDYGKSTLHGWHADHYPVPASFGGRKVPGNLQALHWRRNCSLGGLLGSALKSP